MLRERGWAGGAMRPPARHPASLPCQPRDVREPPIWLVRNVVPRRWFGRLGGR
jgi:hypothetical protein